MRTVEILGKNYSSMQEIHEMLAKELDFPDYYGKNLDALYDVLTEESLETEITINFEGMEEGRLKDSLRRMATVISDVTAENEKISLVIVEL